MEFNAAKWLEDSFGTYRQLAAHARAAAFPVPTEPQYKKWVRRNQISAEWLPRLLYLNELRKKRASTMKGYVVPIETSQPEMLFG